MQHIYCLYFSTSIHSPSPVPEGRGRRGLNDQDLWRSSEEWCMPSPLQRWVQECGEKGPSSSGGPQDGGEGPQWVRERGVGSTGIETVLCWFVLGINVMLTCAYSGRRLTPQGQRDLDRIAGQVGYCTCKIPLATVHMCLLI